MGTSPTSSPHQPEFALLRDRFIENPAGLADAELDRLIALLREEPARAVELREQLMVGDLLGQKLGIDRKKFLAQVNQRIGDFERGEQEIYDQVADLRALAEAELERPPAPPPQSVWIKTFAVLAAILLLGITVGVVQYLPANSRQVAVVEAAVGDVKVTRGAESLAVTPGLVISTGDTIAVADNSSLRLKYGNNLQRNTWTYVNVAGGSQIQIDADPKTQAKRVVIERGDLFADVAAQRQGAPMIFTTPHALATVLGTQLRLVVEGDATRLDVTEGVVQFTHKSAGKSYAVEARKFGVASENSLTMRDLQWPEDRTDVAFLFEGADRETIVRNPENNNFWENPLESKLAASVTNSSSLLLAGGSFQSADAGRDIASVLRGAGKFSLEISLAADQSRLVTPGIIMAMLEPGGGKNFSLEQQGAELMLYLRTTGVAAEQAVNLGTIEADVPTHLAITYESGNLVWYRNGSFAGSTKEITGDLKNWGDGTLIFGSDLTGMRTWRGVISIAAIYSRNLDARQLARNELDSRVLHGHKLSTECWTNFLPRSDDDQARLENAPRSMWKPTEAGVSATTADAVFMTLPSPKGSVVDARCDFISRVEPYEVHWNWTLEGEPLEVILRQGGDDELLYSGELAECQPVADQGLLPQLVASEPMYMELLIHPEMDSVVLEVLVNGQSRLLAHLPLSGMTPGKPFTGGQDPLKIVFPQGRVDVQSLKMRDNSPLFAP